MIEFHKSLNSTNDYLKKNIKKYKNFDLIWTLNQRKGRGRGHKKWHSLESKSLTFSLVVKTKPQLKSIPISLIAAVSLCELFEKLKGLESKKIHIKWPNDILINGDKISGILVDEVLDHWIIGIGINVNHSSKEIERLNLNLQNELKSLKVYRKNHKQNSQRPATSLFKITKNTTNIEELLKKLHRQLIDNYQLYQSNGLSPLAKRWKRFSLCTTEKEIVGFLENGKIKKAILKNLTQNGVVVLVNHLKKKIPWENLVLIDA